MIPDSESFGLKSADRPLFWTQSYWDLANFESTVASTKYSSRGGEIFYQTAHGKLSVPGAATFGGWWPNDGKRMRAGDFVEIFEGLFKSFPVSAVEIRLPPEYFYPDVFLPQSQALRLMGAHETQDSVQIFPIHRDFDSDSISYLPKGERWWVRKFYKEGGEVRPANPHEFASAYEIIRLNKQRRGATTSISLRKFLHVLEEEPQTYRCWLAIADREILGSALTVDIDQETTYVFYWADTLAGRKRSAVTAIFASIVSDASSRGVSVIDLGLSSIRGDIDEGLFSFKKHLGAHALFQSSFRLDRTEQ